MKELVSVSVRAALAGGMGLLVAQTPALASGFALPEVSAAGIGLSNAIVANPKERGAFSYNAAAMGFHNQSSLSVGGVVIGPSFSVDTASGSHDSQGADWLGAPMIQGALVLNDQWRLGLAVNAPFGLETRWELGTYPDLSKPIPLPPTPLYLPAGLDHPTQSKLEISAVTPTVAFRVNENLSLAAGADYYDGRKAVLNTAVSNLEGDGDAWGWNLGALYSQGPWSVGATYHSAATVDIDGKVTSPLRPAVDAKVDLHLPWRLQLGVRYEIDPQLAVEVDWTRTGWSEFDAIEVKSKATGAILSLNANKWDDANAYRIGMTYDVLSTTQLRFGYTYDQTGQDDDYFSGRVPDNDRHLFSIGVGHNLGDGWAIDAGYMYIHFDDRNYHGDKVYLPLPRPADINGTSAMDGKYEASAHLLGLEVRKTF
jgi:long-chain fatty acid transport protein